MRPTLRLGNRWLVGGTALLALTGGGAAAYAETRPDPASTYRLASASTGAVEETLTSAGTVDSAHRADLTFDTGGTVEKVRVTLGQQVRAGEVIATLDATDAQTSLDSARAALAKARAQLVSDEDAQSSTVTSSQSSSAPTVSGQQAQGGPSGGQSGKPGGQSGSPGTTTQGGPTQSGTSTTAVATALAQLATQQQAVTTGQSSVTQALSDAAAALSAQTSACASSNSTGTTTSTPSSGATSGATASGSDGTSSGSGLSQTCQDALSTVQDKQQTVKNDEQALAEALGSLTATLQTAVTALQQASTPSTSSGTGPTGTGATAPDATTSASRTAAGSTSSAVYLTRATSGVGTSAPTPFVAVDSATGSGSGTGASGPSGTVTAATLAKDQAAIDTARAGVVDAQRTVEATVVTAPISGTVASLDLASGASVASGDTAAVVTSGKALLVDTTVSESKIRDVTIGQRVLVSTPGSTTTSTGTVSAIGVTADTSSSSVAYPVTVEVPNPASMLASGSAVVLQIVTDTASDVVTVPSSAVTTTGTRSTVRVYSAGTVETVPVTLGAVGATRTQITSGLKSGQQVVLADLDEAVTGAASSVTTGGGGFGGPGGSGGTGGPPGGGAR